MDILQPQLVWVEGRCYRFCDSSAWSHDKELGPYEEETYEPDYGSNDEESCDASIEIVPFKNNRFKHSFHVNSHFYRFIIGSKGSTLKRLCVETKTNIQVPRAGQDGDVVILGHNRRDIMAARTRLDLLIETSRSKLEFTHFISIPVNSDEIKQNFIKFKEEILRENGNGVRKITEELFQKPEKLHLTIIMLVLLDDNDRQRAISALENCKTKIILPALEQSGDITLEFRGVEIMNDDPSEVQVLWIQIHDESGHLQKILDDITNYFIDEGLTRRQYDKVKIHVTAMNTKFLKSKVQEYNRKLETFDATNILKAHKNTFFGKMKLSTIHLSQRHKKSKDGYYQATAKVDLVLHQ